MHYKIINKKKKIATMMADLLGYLLWLPVNIFKKNTPLTGIKEILVIRTAYIGDVVMTLPVLKPLRELYPDARITFLTSFAARDIFLNNPYVDDVLAYDAFWFYPKASKEGIGDYLKFLKILRSKRYDMVIESRADIRDILLLTYLCRGRYRVSYNVGGGGYLLTHVVPYREIKHKVDYHLDMVKHLGGNIGKVEWGISLTAEEKVAVKALLGEVGILPADLLVGIHPGGRKGLKCWAAAKFAETADRLISEYGAKIIFTGSPQETGLIADIIQKMENHKQAVNSAGKANLRIISGLISRLDLFICNDSAPIHIASAMKTPTVAIFGPSKSRETGPYGNIHRVVEKGFPCRFSCDEDVCLQNNFNVCMEAIQVEDVLAAAREVLNETNGRVKYHGI
ncbi:MAG: glycosyltransferase family 9 protein [Candidatus Schekmanbacteria bacterium]|nr:glycosyltransferase family 9 protein [Candidatus Schekmanbacteria bacterium]